MQSMTGGGAPIIQYDEHNELSGSIIEQKLANDAASLAELYEPNKFGLAHSLTPRSAYVFIHCGHSLVDMIQKNPDLFDESFPEICRPFLKDEDWREKFYQCLLRIAARISKGMGPKPNCTGEEFALYLIKEFASDPSKSTGKVMLGDAIKILPEHWMDDCFEDVYSNNVDDEDVLALFDNPDFCVNQENEDFRENLHPEKWFVTHAPKRKDDHLLESAI